MQIKFIGGTRDGERAEVDELPVFINLPLDMPTIIGNVKRTETYQLETHYDKFNFVKYIYRII